jgi:hypothetical protein
LYINILTRKTRNFSEIFLICVNFFRRNMQLFKRKSNYFRHHNGHTVHSKCINDHTLRSVIQYTPSVSTIILSGPSYSTLQVYQRSYSQVCHTVHSKCINDHTLRSVIQYTPSVSTIILSGLTYSTLQVYQRSYSQVRHTVHSKCINDHTLRSDIFLPKCPTNVRQIWESTLSKSDYLVGYRGLGRTWEWIFKDFFLHFSRWICQTFCDRCVFVSVLSFRCVECAST